MSPKLLVPALICLASASLSAFPPAPYHTLYGTVRDQVGQALAADGAVLILLKGSTEIGRTPITQSLQLDQNYEINVRLDQNRGGTALYSPGAVATQGLFSLVVEMNGSRYYPIEVSGNLTAGKGGERVRLDLNLGADLDGDGLPDIWEQWMLYQAGHFPDGDGNWPIHLIDRNGDLDGDGLSNWFEYLAGTFAGDADEKFDLVIKQKLASSVRLEFYGIAGKTYTIEKSADLRTWARVPFSIGTASGTSAETFRATDIGIHTAFAPAPGSARDFYRLTVR